jgi:hypothetical protein
MSDAYLAHSLTFPTGTSHFINRGLVAPYCTYFVRCEVTIHSELALGPFPVKRGRKDAKIVYPTLPGKYMAVLWKEQIEDCIKAGCTVVMGDGIGWRYLTNDTAHFCRLMHNYRMAATNGTLEHGVKKTTVSGLGQFGMSGEFYRLIAEDNGQDIHLKDDEGYALSYYIHKDIEYDMPDMIHWFNYLIMQTARSLYKYSLPYAIEGRLIMTNYDALIIVERDERSRYYRKHSLEALMQCNAGDLRWEELTNVTILGDRSLKCDQKVITPGVPHEVTV